jgi:hypothetical protein
MFVEPPIPRGVLGSYAATEALPKQRPARVFRRSAALAEPTGDRVG